MMKGIAIFANHKTKERMLVFLDPTSTNIMQRINDKFGGNWIKVNEFCYGDIIKFTSDELYLGYDGRKDNNYCQGALIKKGNGI